MSLVGQKIAFIGGGPSALFLMKSLLETRWTDFSVSIFEIKDKLGSGMPYSEVGAGPEHVTNISANEIPGLFESVKEYISKQPKDAISFDIKAKEFNEYKVMPRLFFGKYLESQFESYLEEAKAHGIEILIHTKESVVDITDISSEDEVVVELANGEKYSFNKVVICTGHTWPATFEGKINGYFDSPYPPKKLFKTFNHTVCIRGAGLTAIDATRTLASANGQFEKVENGDLEFISHKGSEDFRIVMHTRQGLLPSVRFHLQDPKISKKTLLNEQELEKHKNENSGFISLDFVFEKDFKEELKDRDPALYEEIKDLKLEEFVELVMNKREEKCPFKLFYREYEEAERSIDRQEPIHWKELLTQLSFAINNPAKHFSAEDRLRLDRALMPLIALIIAFVPQSSCKQLLALHKAGRLDIIPVGNDSTVEELAEGGVLYNYINAEGEEVDVTYKTFIDCVGQHRMEFKDFPFKSLLSDGQVAPAVLKFKENDEAIKEIKAGNKKVRQDFKGDYQLEVRGIAVNDDFQVINSNGNPNPRIFCLAVPHMNGHNPDYSGLDFCDSASKRVVEFLSKEGKD